MVNRTQREEQLQTRFISPFVVLCAGFMACNVREQVVEPGPYTPAAPAPEESAFRGVLLRSYTVALVEADTARVKAVPADINGNEISVPFTVSYSSHTPSIVKMSDTGLMTALAPGYADISISLVVGHTTKSTWFRAYVFAPTSPSSVILTSDKNGWRPYQAQVSPGGTVEWRIAPIDWAGMPVSHVYLMRDDYHVVDSIDVSAGTGTRRFESAGFWIYCTGICWDQPDWGVIYVR